MPSLGTARVTHQLRLSAPRSVPTLARGVSSAARRAYASYPQIVVVIPHQFDAPLPVHLRTDRVGLHFHGNEAHPRPRSLLLVVVVVGHGGFGRGYEPTITPFHPLRFLRLQNNASNFKKINTREKYRTCQIAQMR
jgi:hypothetical protein